MVMATTVDVAIAITTAVVDRCGEWATFASTGIFMNEIALKPKQYGREQLSKA
jgi:hypothetical protein